MAFGQSFKSWVSLPNFLVVFQLASAFMLLVSGPILSADWALLACQGVGLLLGLVAVIQMKVFASKFNVSPRVKNGAKLVRSGMYRFIRHPMYTSLLLYFIPALIDHFSWFRAVFSGILVVTILIKLNYEEKLLDQAFSGYAAYKKQSWRLIPFIF